MRKLRSFCSFLTLRAAGHVRELYFALNLFHPLPDDDLHSEAIALVRWGCLEAQVCMPRSACQ